MPPCQETVEWFVFDFEWELDQAQFDTLHAVRSLLIPNVVLILVFS